MHHDGMECAPREESHRPCAADSTPVRVLPRGCALGVPIHAGSVATLLPQGTALFTISMHMVQQDDYHSLAELARRGYAQVLMDRRCCGFKIALSPEFSESRGLPETLSVSRAGLIHYAVSIGSFRAATALLVMHPELATSTCSVSLTNGADREGHEDAWTALQLARLFCELYADDGSDPAVAKTLREFTAARLVLEACAADCRALNKKSTEERALPFIGLPTPQERIAAAGSDADAVMAALIKASSSGPVAGTDLGVAGAWRIAKFPRLWP